MAAYEVLLLNTAVPQIQAAQSGDTYVVPRDIAFSAVANLANGTYLLPSLAFSSDTDTGIFRQGANQLGFTAGGGTDQMVLTSTGLGIGTTSPGAKLGVTSPAATAAAAGFRSGSTDSVYLTLGRNAYEAGIGVTGSTVLLTGASAGDLNIYTNLAGAAIRFGTGSAGTIQATLDSSGNLGLGVTPSAWTGNRIALQVGNGSLMAVPTESSYFASSANTYDDSADKYISSNYATRYKQHNGIHSWFTAPSGTAGNAISFTQAMTLDASGDLMIGTTTKVPYSGNAGSTNFTLSGTSNPTTARPAFTLKNSDDSVRAWWVIDANNGAFIGTYTNNYFGFQTNNTEHARITSGGDFQTSSGNSVMVGGTAARATTAGTNRVDIFDGTAPVGTLANGVSFYSASGEANVMDAAGNATLLSPHDAVTNEWIFRSKHTPTGKVLKIDVERLLKFVNDHFGLDAVHEFIED